MNPFQELTQYIYFPSPPCIDPLDCLLYYASKIANILFILVIIGGVLVILYSAFLFVSGGEENIKNAKKLIKWGIIGVIVGALSLVIVKVFLETLIF